MGERNMFNSKNLTMILALLILLTAAPLVASDDSSGSAKFVVTSTLLVSGTELQAGQYDVSWQSGADSENTEVLFVPVGKETGIKVQGKIEKVAKKYDYNSMAIGTDPSGRKVIKQLQFSGKNIRIVF
jgi:hypothetical protein